MRLYLTLLLLISLTAALSQPHSADSLGLGNGLPKTIYFDHLSVKDGLSNNSVNCILQDREGYLWFGTNDGLNKYDGYSFTVLQADLKNPAHTFQSNQISGLHEDHMNRLWAVTEGGGLHEINKKSGLVTPHPIRAENASRWNSQHSVYEDSQGILWLGTFGGLARYEPARRHFTLYPSPQPDLPVKTVFEDRQHRFWVATLRGLYLFDQATGRFTLVPAPVPAGPQPTFISFYQDDREVLWLGTAGHGLFQIDLRTLPLRLVLYNPEGKINPYIFLNSIHQDPGSKRVWVGTTNGLQCIDPLKQQVVTYHPDPTSPQGISSNSAQAVYYDRAGTLWVGTDNGIDRQTTNAKPFQVYQVTPNTSAVNLSENKVSTLLVDNRNRIWFSNQKTICRLNPRTNQLDALPPERAEVNGQSRSYIHTLVAHGSAGIWVGTWHFLYYLDQATEKYTKYLSEVPVQFICADRTNNLWIGGEGGIAFYDTHTHRFTYYKYGQPSGKWLPDKYIHGLLVSRTGDVWVLVQRHGICRLNPETGHVQYYTAGPKGQLNTNEVNSIYEDKDGVIWVGTHRGGLNRFDPATGLFSAITMQNGLSGNSIAGITADKAGHIWISTNKGLCQYDPQTKAIHTYGIKDGLPSNDFQGNAVFRDESQLYFGSLNGIVHFNPTAIHDNTNPFPVYITGLKVMDQPRPLTDSLPMLSHNENFLSFEFAALTYQPPEQNKYAYQLVGIDKNWVQSADHRFANYPNLPPGRYTFQVKAANSDGVWNRKAATMHFIIRPPWWATWWAYGLYALLLAGAIWGYIRFYTNRLRQRQEMELNRREATQLKAVDELKSRFFSNITHEFRTPLSLILSPVEKLLQENQFNRSTYQTLELVQRNANQLLRLINQLLDLSKLEANSMGLTLMRGNVTAFVQELVEQFRPIAEQKGVQLLYTGYERVEEGLFDADKWEKIVTNLVSNALKFTHTGGQVSITLTPLKFNPEGSNPSVQIAVQDTGIGISAEKLPHIFDRFYQVDDSRTRAFEGTGIGLALVKELVELIDGTISVTSEPEKGTRFLLTLPVQPLSDTKADVPPVLMPNHNPSFVGPILEHTSVTTTIIPDEEQQMPLILVVEDNTELRDFLTNELANAYQVLKAADGAEGWQLTKTELPDIVISDVMMPLMDGYELTERIKSHPDTNHIAVVMLTAKSAQHSRIEGLEKGADDYLSKPFHLGELHLRLRNLLAHQQKLRDFYLRQLTHPDTPISLETVQDPFLHQVYELLEGHLDNSSLNVDWLAEKLAMSRKTLYRKIHSLTQLAPNELIRRYRVRKAVDLLVAGNNATETAYRVGFKTPSHFSIVFKELYHQTPSEFIINRVAKV